MALFTKNNFLAILSFKSLLKPVSGYNFSNLQSSSSRSLATYSYRSVYLSIFRGVNAKWFYLSFIISIALNKNHFAFTP